MKRMLALVLAKILASYVARTKKRHDVKLVAVTGSVGKTSARVAIAQTLASKYKLPSLAEHSYNVPVATEMSFFGLSLPQPIWNPLAWLGRLIRIHHLSHHFPYEAVVIEINEDEFEKMEYFFDRVSVDCAVITEITPTHMARYDSLEELTDKVLRIRQYSAWSVFNADSQELAKLAGKKATSSYGMKKTANVMFGNIKRDKDLYFSTELHIDKFSKDLTTRQISQQGLYSLLAAAAVAQHLGVSNDQIAASLVMIESVKGRMNLLTGKNNSLIIDDSYNASPASDVAALATLTEINAKRRIAVLGSMNELGDYAPKAHQEVARVAAKSVDLLITVGELAEQYLAPAALHAGLTQDQVKAFRNPYEAGHFLVEKISPGDVILVKGSQNGVFTEEVSRILLADSIDPRNVLVRQSTHWKKAKRQAFGV